MHFFSSLLYVKFQFLFRLTIYTIFSQETFSTLDLLSVDRAQFLLIIAPVESSYKLARAALEVAENIKVPLKICVVWPENSSDGNCTSQAALQPWKENFIDIIESKKSPSSPSWWILCEMTERGAILVRPDEHIAWRSRSGNLSDPVHKMKQVFKTILGLDSSTP